MELLCPKGHASTESDFCSECGAKIAGAADLESSGGDDRRSHKAAKGAACPDCGAPCESAGAFCEVCGHNFSTGARGQIPVADSAAATAAPATAHVWALEVSVDPSLRETGSPEAPLDFAPFNVVLDGVVSLIGRQSAARAIFPEVPLDLDDAVSHRHAILTRDGDRSLLLRDIGSANGTRVNGQAVNAMTDVRLKDGDVITLGHWTRLQVKAS